MERQKYLIDTNAAIDYLGQRLPDSGMTFMNTIFDTTPNVSVVTKIEILGFNAPEEHNQLLVDFINDVSVLDLTNDVVDVCIFIRKNHKTKLPDAIIAATAIVYDLTLISRNISDFKIIKDLIIINPHNL